ncbi:MAG: carbon-nitrogen hydrolase family protein [Sphingomonadales bacterium]
MKAAVIQTNAGQTKARNVDAAFALMEDAVRTHAPDIVVLPENFALYSTDAGQMAESAEAFPGGPTYERLRGFARDNGVFLHAGSMSERPEIGDKPFNTSVVFDPSGSEIARYRKIHRFDITAPDGTRYYESDVVGGGRDLVTYRAGGLTFGCAICFDLRFGDMFARLADAGADVIVIPSAFTHTTGKAHWETLIRARAIEHQCYVLAPDQCGTFDGGSKRTWGHSMIVDPWGDVLGHLDEEPGVIAADIDGALIERVRGRIPVRDLKVLA